MKEKKGALINRLTSWKISKVYKLFVGLKFKVKFHLQIILSNIYIVQVNIC